MLHNHIPSGFINGNINYMDVLKGNEMNFSGKPRRFKSFCLVLPKFWGVPVNVPGITMKQMVNWDHPKKSGNKRK